MSLRQVRDSYHNVKASMPWDQYGTYSDIAAVKWHVKWQMVDGPCQMTPGASGELFSSQWLTATIDFAMEWLVTARALQALRQGDETKISPGVSRLQRGVNLIKTLQYYLKAYLYVTD